MQTAQSHIEEALGYSAKEVVRITQNMPAFDLVTNLLDELSADNIIASGYWSGGYKPDVVLTLALKKGETFATYSWILDRLLAEGYKPEKTTDYEQRRSFPFRQGPDGELGIRLVIDATKSRHCKQVIVGEHTVTDYKMVCEDDTPPEPETFEELLEGKVASGAIKEVYLDPNPMVKPFDDEVETAKGPTL